MARQLMWLMVHALLFGSLLHLRATVAQEAASEAFDINAELEKLKGWKAYLESELNKCKSGADVTQKALEAEQQRVAEHAAQIAQLNQAVTEAQTKAAEAESRASQAAAKATESENLANTYSQYYTQVSAQADQLKQELAAATAKVTEAESKASANAAAADASNGESATLRKQLAQAVAEREALEARVAELAAATSQAGGLKGHALAIYDILVLEAARHRDTAVNYANEKLPGFKAKVAEVHAAVSSQLPNVTGFVEQVDGELRPWLKKGMVSVPFLKQYGEDPVVLQAVVYAILAAPLLSLLPVMSICYRLVARRPTPASSRSSESKSARRNKKRQG